MPVDRDVVGRIGKDHPCLLAVHQDRDGIAVQRRAADQAMASKLPDVPRPAARRTLDVRNEFIGGVTRFFW
jgi:hypothetical protein